MKKFSIPEGSTSDTEGMHRGEKRKLVAMSCALFIISGALLYNQFSESDEENEFETDLPESPRMQVQAALLGRFLDLDLNAVGLSEGILADACHLPRDLHAGGTARDLEAVLRNLHGHVPGRPDTSDGA